MRDDQGDNGPAKPKNHRCPPVQHRFKPGQSGNPQGRPPKPIRALMPRQLRRDIISAAEKKIPVKTADGIRWISAIEAVMMKLVNRALQGHGPSMKYFHQIYTTAVLEHYKAHEGTYSFAEMVEHSEATTSVPSKSRTFTEFLNSLRWRTRRF